MARRHLENFPVASFLLPAYTREGVKILYNFARGADDLADDPTVSAPERARALREIDAALQGGSIDVPDWATAYIALCRQGKCSAQDGRDLLTAFTLDQTVTRCASFQAMLEYCRYSALPVGRCFLALCEEKHFDSEALAAVCICLQLLNHLQDIRGDYRDLGRIYLPADWLEAAGVEEAALGEAQSSPALRQVIDQVLDAMQPFMDKAEELPASIDSRRLRMELRWVLAIIRSLHRQLRHGDPLAERIKPGARGKLVALACSFGRPGLTRRSSFYWPMRLAGGDERRALLALHRFLQAIDNAADAPTPTSSSLKEWRQECALLGQGQANTQEGAALLPFITQYQLDVSLLQEVVDGCAMDVSGQMRHPSPDTVMLYCERVAVAPGKLVLAILGHRGEKAEALAHSLGQAIQRTNILRDEKEDAQNDRVYFNAQEKQQFMAVIAEYFLQADHLLRAFPRRSLLPVFLMRDVYFRLFCRLRGAEKRSPHLPLMAWLLGRAMYYRLTLQP